MKRILTGRELNLILRLFIGGMFVYAAWDKVLHPYGFAVSIRAYKIIPFALSNFAALAVSWSELIAGLMLLIGILPRKAAGAIFTLLAVFTLAIATTVVRGMAIDCGCFGSGGGAATSWLLILRNVALLAGAALIILYNDGFLSLYPGGANRQPREQERY
jgi:putative oxidoreductase